MPSLLLSSLGQVTRTPALLSTSKRALTHSTRKMGKQEWMVILPDAPNKLEHRMRVRPQHLEAIKPQVAAGKVVMGGASLESPIKEGEALKITGSVMMAEADTKEEVEQLIKSDIYYREGVWDVEKIQIFPFKSAVRQALN